MIANELRNGPFYSLKRPVLEPETGRSGKQNGPFGNNAAQKSDKKGGKTDTNARGPDAEKKGAKQHENIKPRRKKPREAAAIKK